MAFPMHNLLLVIATLKTGVYADILRLSPEDVYVVENSSVTLTCSSTSGRLTESKWQSTLFGGELATVYYVGQQCITTLFLNNSNSLQGVCNSDGTYSVILKRVDRAQLGSIWQCKKTLASSNKVTISELVPVGSVDIYPPPQNYMKENYPQNFSCKTSPCRPRPNIRWSFRNPIDRTEYNITYNTEEVSRESDDGIVSLEDFLYLRPNRSLNGWTLLCKAWNSIQNPAILSKEVVLNVSYPPDSGPEIHGYRPGKQYHIIEADTGEFSCTITGGNPPASLSWNCFNSESTEKYVNRTIISIITWKALRNQNVCSCESYHIYNGKQAANVSIDVLYPPSKPFFEINSSVIDVANIIENNTVQVFCKSISNPTPNYTWIGSNIPNRTGHILELKVTQHGRYSCIAANRMVRSDNTSRDGSNTSAISVNMLYPPRRIVFRYGNENGEVIRDNKLDVIIGDPFLIYCEADGYPSPVFKWDNFRGGSSLNITALTSDAKKTCDATNWMNETGGEPLLGSNSATVSISVLYPPAIPTITISKGNTNAVTDAVRINVTETDTVELSCYSKSNPEPGYTWFMNKAIIKEYMNVTLADISRKDAGNYTCRVNNFMNRTFGDSVARAHSSGTFLNVLYPPEVGTLINISLIEYSALNITCPIIQGNPLYKNVSWTRRNDDRQWNNKQLLIQNVSRDDDTVYTCTVFSEMTPTFGSVIKKKQSGEFHLNIFFSAEVKNFFVLGKEYKETIVVNETEEVALSCTVEANPAPDITIRSPKHKQIASAFNTKTLHHTLRNVSYGNAGQYLCTGRNTYTNGVPSNSELILIVRCPPRPSADSYNVGKVTTTLSADAVLQFTAHDFLDEPDKTVFTWFKANVSIGYNGSKIAISSYGLQSNLSIRNVTETDLGQYRVRVKNSVGNYLHIYQLQAKAPKEEPVESNSSDMVRIVAGSVSSVIIVSIAGIIFGVFIYRRRNVKETGKVYQNVPFSGKQLNTANSSKRNKGTTKKRKPETVHIEETTFEGLQEVDDVPILTNERTEYCNSPDIIEKLERIQVSELFWYVSEKSEDMFEADYQKLPTELQKPCTCARKPENIALNRYNGIYPYDHSRVTLEGHPDFFINACYIDGYKSSKTYIASLGPTAKTTRHFETFWQMIWYERSDIIVMLTNLREPSGMKCEQYWPKEGKTEQYGDVCVSSQTTEVFAEYTITTFSVSCDEERRSLTHLHYTAWPDKTVPEDVTSLIEFRQRMKITPTSSEGPIVVHCSAGIGRTGTLIALDRLIEEGQDKGSVDVFECVNNMREQRVKMVQTHEQYIYIHKALVNALTFDCEALPVETFNEYVDTTNNNMYSRLFQQLRQTVEKDSKAEADDRVKNESLTDKNRQGADIPGRKCRVLLYLDRRGEGSEYINAVYINSFKKKDYFISTQSPLASTVTDFIAMIYQENCSCIVTMENLKEPGMKVGHYLPDGNHTLSLGNFKVSCSVLETKHHYVVRKMKIKYAGQFESGEKSIYHFQYTKWQPGQDTPANEEEFVQFVNEVEEYASELGEERSHVVVHCLKANERSGLFCAVAILMEKIKFEGQVSVSNTLRHLRTRRRTAIISMEQLKFCYLAASAYIKKYLK